MPNSPHSPELFPPSERHRSKRHRSAVMPEPPMSQELFPSGNLAPEAAHSLIVESLLDNITAPDLTNNPTLPLASPKKQGKQNDRSKRQFPEISQEPRSSSSQSEDSDPFLAATSSQEVCGDLLFLSQEPESPIALTPPTFQLPVTVIATEATTLAYQPQDKSILPAQPQLLIMQQSSHSVACLDTLPEQAGHLPRERIRHQTDSNLSKPSLDMNEAALVPIRKLINLSRFPRQHPEKALAMLKDALKQYKVWTIQYPYYRYGRHKEMVTHFAISFARVYLALNHTLNNTFFAETHFNLAGNIREILNDNQALLAETIMYQGELLRQQDKLPDALQKLEEAFAIAKEIKPLSLRARIHLVFASTYLDGRKSSSAQKEAQEAFTIFKQCKFDDTHPWMKKARELLFSDAGYNLSARSSSTHSFGNPSTSSLLQPPAALVDNKSEARRAPTKPQG